MKNREKYNEYMRKYMAKYRKKYPEKIKNDTQQRKLRYIENKLWAISSMGGCCQKCGYKKNYTALEFHHPNKEKKLTELSFRLSRKNLIKYIKDTVLLCANCHREKEYPNAKMDL